MKKQVIFFLMAVLALCFVGSSWAFESVTAARAYEMVKNNEAIMIDIRTLEECYWVGSPALEPNGMPIAYNLPWKLWPNHELSNAGDYSKPAMHTLTRLFDLILGNLDRSSKMILICRSGHRESAAAQELEAIGFTNIYKIDNYLKVQEGLDASAAKIGGKGGFQGSSSDSPADFAGYRGWPGRTSSYMSVYPAQDPEWLPSDSSQSVSWMDTGLPVTQKLDPDKIVLKLLGLDNQQ